MFSASCLLEKLPSWHRHGNFGTDTIPCSTQHQVPSLCARSACIMALQSLKICRCSIQFQWASFILSFLVTSYFIFKYVVALWWCMLDCNMLQQVENHTIHDSVNFTGALHKNLTSLSKTLFLALVLDSWLEESTHHVTCLHTHGIASHTWLHMPCQSRASLSPRETRSNNVKRLKLFLWIPVGNRKNQCQELKNSVSDTQRSWKEVCQVGMP